MMLTHIEITNLKKKNNFTFRENVTETDQKKKN